jgi:hypothetical protein
MEATTSFHNPSTQGAAKAGKRERSFELSLPALVNGLGAAGSRFEERTEIRTISAQEASFRLEAPVLIGSRLTLCLDVPRTLILEKHLRLLVTGTVVGVGFEKTNGKRQLVTACLDRAFRLHPGPAAMP